MKYLLTFLLGVGFLNNGKSQILLKKYGLPKNNENIHDYNQFVINKNISWACEFNISFPFKMSNDSSFFLWKYITDNAKNGEIKSYSPFLTEKKWAKTNNSTEYFKELNLSFYKQAFRDTHPAYSFDFYQLLFIEQHKLKSHIIVAGAEYEVRTDQGILIGDAPHSYTSLNPYPSKMDSNDQLYFLGESYMIFNFDSLESLIGMKKVFGMNLVNSIWFDIEKGYNKMVDLRGNKLVSAKHALSYPIEDSISIPDYDSVGNLIGSRKFPAVAAASLPATVGISQKWYYNKTKDIFINKILFADLYLENINRDQNGGVKSLGLEKRFKVFFE